MTSSNKFTIGLIILTLFTSGIVILELNDQVRIRVDQDKSTIYVPHETMPWIWVVGGREYNRLFDGSSIMNRRTSGITIDTVYSNSSDIITVTRMTPYQRGPVIVDTYVFNSALGAVELFPISHTVEVYNASGYFYRYSVDELTDVPPKRKLAGETELSFGRNIKVSLHPGYRWAWLGWPYGSDSVSAQYNLPSDYEVFHVRLFDPIVAVGTTTETAIATAGDVGKYHSITIDTSDFLHVCAYNDTADDLIYGNNTEGSWTFTTVATAGIFGKFCDVEVDATDEPMIAVYNDTADDLYFCNGSDYTWDCEAVATDTIIGQYADLIIYGGQAHIIAFNSSNTSVEYFNGSSGSWTGPDFVAIISGYELDVDIDSTGEFHISAVTSNLELFYINGTYGDWDTTEVIGGGLHPVWGYSSIAVDSNDIPHLVYIDYNHTGGTIDGNLTYTNFSDGAWDNSTFDHDIEVYGDDDASPGGGPSIALTGSDLPLVLAYNKTDGDLRACISNFTDWICDSIGPISAGMTYNSYGKALVWDSTNSKAWGVFYNGTGDDLYLLGWTPELGTTSVTVLNMEGTSADTTYELGSEAQLMVNLTVSGLPIVGPVYLSIDAPGYGTNYTNGNSPFYYNWTTTAGINQFSDGDYAKNYTFAGADNKTVTAFLMHPGDEFINASVNLTGYDSGGLPTDVEIWLDGDVLAGVYGQLSESSGDQTTFNTSASAVNATYTSDGGGSETFYVYINKNANVTSAYVNISAWGQDIQGEGTTISTSGDFMRHAIASNGTHLYLRDYDFMGGGHTLYEYFGNGTLISSWQPDDSSHFIHGIATNDTHVFGDDEGTGPVVCYTRAGFDTGTTFTLQTGNDDITSMAYNGSHFLVLDIDTDCEVFIYDSDFTYVSTWDVAAAGTNDNCIGITADSDYIWIADSTDESVYKYNTDTLALIKEIDADFLIVSNDIAYSDDYYLWFTYSANVERSWENASAWNPKLDVGADDDYEWTYSGYFNQKNNKTSNLATEIEEYLASCAGDENYSCDVPFRLVSSSQGKMGLTDLNITRSVLFNPVTLNVTKINTYAAALSNWTNVTMNVSSEHAGIVEISDIKFFKYGMSNVTITANWYGNATYDASSDSQVALLYYSDWDYEIGNNYDYLEFIPQTPTAENVTPYGQTPSIPILNITTDSTNDKNMSWSMQVNETYAEGTGNDGTLTGGPTWNTSGYWGYAINFDGVNDVIILDTPNPSNLNFTGDFTICAWVFPRETPTSAFFIAHNNAGRDIEFGQDGTRWYARVTNSTGDPNADRLGSLVSVDQWMYLCLRRNATHVALFENGTTDGLETVHAGGTQATPTSTWRIGKDDKYEAAWNGTLDDIRLYDRALSKWEMDILRGGGDLATPPVTLWKFNTGTGVTAYDSINRCVIDVTVSNSSTKTDGTQLASATWETFQTNTSNGTSFGLWMWSDYDCYLSNWALWQPTYYFRGCCIGCVCSEEVS